MSPPEPDTFTLFFYGTLLAPTVLYRVIFGTPRPSPLDHPSMQSLVFRSALLSAHRRHKVAQADYPAILPDPEGVVRGTVVTGLTEGDRWRLDLFEGIEYERQKVRARILKDVKLDEAAHLDEKKDVHHKEHNTDSQEEPEEVDAETYIWIGPRSSLEPQEWDFDEFKRDKMRFWMGDTSFSDEGNDDLGKDTQIDEGFEDVDRAVAELEAENQKNAEANSNADVKDPTGGRGANGHITRQLNDTRTEKGS